jgi:hypothetical protein
MKNFAATQQASIVQCERQLRADEIRAAERCPAGLLASAAYRP